MEKTTILLICGIYNLAFAVFHIFFWKIFNWKNDLRKTSVANRAIMQILNIRLIYVFLLFGFIYLFFPQALLETKFGMFILIGVLVFWIGRTIEQFIFLRIKSKMVNILTVIFMIGVIIHSIPLIK